MEQKRSLEREFIQHIKQQSNVEKELKVRELQEYERQVRELEEIEMNIISKLQNTIAWEAKQTQQFKEEVNSICISPKVKSATQRSFYTPISTKIAFRSSG